MLLSLSNGDWAVSPPLRKAGKVMSCAAFLAGVAAPASKPAAAQASQGAPAQKSEAAPARSSRAAAAAESPSAPHSEPVLCSSLSPLRLSERCTAEKPPSLASTPLRSRKRRCRLLAGRCGGSCAPFPA